MASKTTLNTKSLEALGAKRLAELLIELSTGDDVVEKCEAFGSLAPAGTGGFRGWTPQTGF